MFARARDRRGAVIDADERNAWIAPRQLAGDLSRTASKIHCGPDAGEMRFGQLRESADRDVAGVGKGERIVALDA